MADSDPSVMAFLAIDCLFAFNCFRHSAKLIVQQYDKEALVILSREGVTQGDPLSMG